jgi:hypothetical protein
VVGAANYCEVCLQVTRVREREEYEVQFAGAGTSGTPHSESMCLVATPRPILSSQFTTGLDRSRTRAMGGPDRRHERVTRTRRRGVSGQIVAGDKHGVVWMRWARHFNVCWLERGVYSRVEWCRVL